MRVTDVVLAFLALALFSPAQQKPSDLDTLGAYILG